MGDELEVREAELDWLERKLRDEAQYIDDAGFTRGVMQKLPARRRATRSVRALVLIVSAIVASAAAYLLSGGRFIFEAFAHAELFSPLTIFLGALAIGLAITGAAAYAALKRSDAL